VLNAREGSEARGDGKRTVALFQDTEGVLLNLPTQLVGVTSSGAILPRWRRHHLNKPWGTNRGEGGVFFPLGRKKKGPAKISTVTSI
jgi:hypothetical protein